MNNSGLSNLRKYLSAEIRLRTLLHSTLFVCLFVCKGGTGGISIVAGSAHEYLHCCTSNHSRTPTYTTPQRAFCLFVCLFVCKGGMWGISIAAGSAHAYLHC